MNIKSISGKIFFFYLILSLLNISFFSVIIYENQIELIVKNTILQQKETASKLSENIHLISRQNISSKAGLSDDFIGRTTELLKKSLDSFIIITTEGNTLAAYNRKDYISGADLANAVRSETARSFSGDLYFSRISEDGSNITFYVPLMIRAGKALVVIFTRDLSIINESMKNLYKEIGAVIFFIALFHALVAVLFFRVFVRPISILHKQSRLIAEGSYNARADINSSDEIGSLAEAFNIMAGSIEEKIVKLEEYRQNMESELMMAGEVQKLIFPERPESGSLNIEIFSSSFSRVSGDYYDFTGMPDGTTALLLADVSGHGVPAALMTMILKENFDIYTQTGTDPAEMFRLLNSKICGMFSDVKIAPKYFSGFCIQVDKNNNALYCNAGHPHPLLLSGKTGEIRQLGSEGGLVGVFEDMNDYFRSEKTELERGDKILLLTDGIIEAKSISGEQFGWEPVNSALKECTAGPAESLIQNIVRRLESFTDISSLQDDATILVMEVK